ncbi:MAG TPA: ElyC/SanA/YdcF family protein [Mobilitalea sp.]|nr:ElyC/SanA/YdcF family protein [Mobilitalea sp.]
MSPKMKNRLKWVVVCLLILGLIGIIAICSINFYVRASVKNRILTENDAGKLEKVDCILILGAGLKNKKPSNMLEDRLKLGIELYKAGVSNRILMSGDHGRTGYDEVNTMKQYAIDAGVPSESIFMDHAGFSTYESLYRARDIFQADKMVVVTQRYHLYRALYDGRGLDLDVYGVASNQRKYAGQTKRDLREVLARIKDFFYIMIKPKPTYLGDAIPVSGNGDVTNDE